MIAAWTGRRLRASGGRGPRANALRYCVKVSLATLVGYLLSFGDVTYAVYGAFTAALVVGTSRGEDIGSAANRARGSIVGMFVGIAASHWAPHPAIAVALGIGVTSYVAMGCGWGQAAARVGASLCAGDDPRPFAGRDRVFGDAHGQHADRHRRRPRGEPLRAAGERP
jgi:uncharacterized membrane protein YccC